MFYIQNKGFVGNCLRWWRAGGYGYTCNLNEAGQFSEAEARRIWNGRPLEDIPWKVEEIDQRAERHVDGQILFSASNSGLLSLWERS